MPARKIGQAKLSGHPAGDDHAGVEEEAHDDHPAGENEDAEAALAHANRPSSPQLERDEEAKAHQPHAHRDGSPDRSSPRERQEEEQVPRPQPGGPAGEDP